jgi:hypothetical protein
MGYYYRGTHMCYCDASDTFLTRATLLHESMHLDFVMNTQTLDGIRTSVRHLFGQVYGYAASNPELGPSP